MPAAKPMTMATSASSIQTSRPIATATRTAAKSSDSRSSGTRCCSAVPPTTPASAGSADEQALVQVQVAVQRLHRRAARRR